MCVPCVCACVWTFPPHELSSTPMARRETGSVINSISFHGDSFLYEKIINLLQSLIKV